MGLIFSFLVFIIGLLFFYFVAARFFLVSSMRKMYSYVSSELQQFPESYQHVRKAVANKNTRSEGIEHFVKGMFVRWYKRGK